METTQAKKDVAAKSEKVSGPWSNQWLVITAVVLCVAMSWVGVVDKKTEEYVDGAIKQALFAYASARTLNAGISTLQSAEFGAGVGVNASLHPFEALDPVNDMVEDFATAMKYAIGSLMTQKLLVEIMATSTFKWLLMGAAALLLTSLLLFNGSYSAPLLKGFLLVALVRFLFVITVLICGLVDGAFVNDKTETEIKKVEIATEAVGRFEDSSADLTPSEREEIDQQIQRLEVSREELTESIDLQREKVASADTQLLKEKETLKNIKGEMSAIEKLNIFKRDKNYSEAKQAKNGAKTVYEDQFSILKNLELHLEEVEDAMADQQTRLVGKKSFLENAKAKISALKNLANYNHIKQVITSSIESMLMLIALFIFKTLIMPIVFLFLILRAFKALWGVDLVGSQETNTQKS